MSQTSSFALLCDPGIDGGGNLISIVGSPSASSSSSSAQAVTIPSSNVLSSSSSSSSSSPSWWEKSNWFRVSAAPISENSMAMANDQLALSSSSVNSLQNELSSASASVPGYAIAFNRFLTTPSSPNTSASVDVKLTVPPSSSTSSGMSTTTSTVSSSSSPSPSVSVISTRPLRRRAEFRRQFVGMSPPVLRSLDECVFLPLLQPKIFTQIGVKPSVGVMLSGISGSGKTFLIDKIMNILNVYQQRVSGSEMLTNAKNDREEQINSSSDSPNEHLLEVAFRLCVANSPAILFIDNIDIISSTPTASDSQPLTRVRQILKYQLDLLSKKNVPVVVIGATDTPQMVCESIRRRGRMDKHIVINKPNRQQRLMIIKDETKKIKIFSDINFEELADKTFGFVRSDLEALCTEAGIEAIREAVRKEEIHEDQLWGEDNEKNDELMIQSPSSAIRMSPFPPSVLSSLFICHKHFLSALSRLTPEIMRSSSIEIPSVLWSDVGGVENLKNEIDQSVNWPLKFPKIFEKFGMKPSAGLMLYGPQGGGKTLMAKAIATQCSYSFFSVKGPELLTSYLGESEKKIRELFAKAREAAPSVIFFDEFDSIAQKRGVANSSDQTVDRIVNQILTEMDEIRMRERGVNVEDIAEKTIFVIAATNRPESIDSALMRPGRFDSLIFVGLPNVMERKQILSCQIHKSDGETPLEEELKKSEEEFLMSLAMRTERFSGADLESLINTARRLAIIDEISQKNKGNCVTKEHFEKALQSARPSVSLEDIKKFEKFNQSMKFQMNGENNNNNQNDQSLREEKERDNDNSTGDGDVSMELVRNIVNSVKRKLETSKKDENGVVDMQIDEKKEGK